MTAPSEFAGTPPSRPAKPEDLLAAIQRSQPERVSTNGGQLSDFDSAQDRDNQRVLHDPKKPGNAQAMVFRAKYAGAFACKQPDIAV